ncbi:conserved hypothetical protein [Ricinus communis]|uniref:Uncharacterized protein n=1 Tax=Ricinus communis TaxID=3988 RepID=B9T9W4_RICCO|nr:conserved hypothetical protein [Ricinus communis]
MAPKKSSEASTKIVMNKGAWTAEEDRKLAQFIEVHGAKRWKTIATKAEEAPEPARPQEANPQKSNDTAAQVMEENTEEGLAIPELNFDDTDLFDFSAEGSYGLDWVNKFLELDEDAWLADKS